MAANPGAHASCHSLLALMVGSNTKALTSKGALFRT